MKRLVQRVAHPEPSHTVESDRQLQLEALRSYLNDKEQQIALLHRQQRDVRFLAKQLAREVQLRLNKRAKRGAIRSGLVYAVDQSITRKLENGTTDSDELLRFIHERDKANIYQRRRSVTDVLRPLPWKVAATLFAFGLMIVTRVAKRLR